MLSEQVRQGKVGIAINVTKQQLLIQVTDTDGEQARAVLSTEEAEEVAEKLVRLTKEIKAENKKPKMDR